MSLPAAAVLAPGFGGSARQPLLVSLAGLLRARKVRTRRVSFPPGRPSEGLAREQQVVARAAAQLAKAGPVRTVLIGRSFGGRVCARLAVAQPPAALVLLGFPLAPRGVLRVEDDAALRALRAPTLIIQGDEDELGPLPLVRAAVAANPSLRLHVLARTGHGFTTRACIRELLDTTGRWLDDVLGG